LGGGCSGERERAQLWPGFGGRGMHNEDQCQLEKSLQPPPAHLPVQVPGLFVECSTRLHPARHFVTNLLLYAPQLVNLCVAKSQ
jgi:hypothetical protein